MCILEIGSPAEFYFILFFSLLACFLFEYSKPGKSSSEVDVPLSYDIGLVDVSYVDLKGYFYTVGY